MKSKTIYPITKIITITQPDESNTWEYEGQIDIAQALSQKFGKNIRQGNNFRVVGAQSALIPTNGTQDLDLGFSASVQLAWAPTTKHSRAAWNNAFKMWRQQKRLSATVGQQVRYDDFEVCYTPALAVAGRTSKIYAGTTSFASPFVDNDAESVAIYGGSSSGSHISLQTMYNNANPIMDPSTTALGVTVKQPKYSAYFPASESMQVGAAWSAGLFIDEDTALNIDKTYYGFGNYYDTWNLLPADNHMNVLCGVMAVNASLLPPDTAWQVADTLRLIVTVYVEGWSSLVNKPRRKTYRRSRRSYRSKPRYSRRKTYRRKYYRRR